ncbi:hypothetical protein [Micromonospora sp. WMMD710]|uniref:hypothetical protein n=1 Tax=Micromonospora sp. WMMD710 TaxID=3016085 RepID=UPI002417A7DC|nr:hypothetical protein [Micromonospora sp. WMMD710]MDG4760380.1 hypothetical protein [Micromonospora sp. WMMD710]
MNPERRAAAITAALTAVEALADEQGWDAFPTLIGVFESTAHTGVGSLYVEELPIDSSIWQMHAMPGARSTVPYWIGLRAITAVLTTAKAPQLRAWTRAQIGPILALAFLCEGLDTSESGRRDATALGLPSTDDGIPVRALTACDVDGRHYQFLRYRGTATITSVVLPDPPAEIRDRGISADLRRVLSTIRA